MFSILVDVVSFGHIPGLKLLLISYQIVDGINRTRYENHGADILNGFSTINRDIMIKPLWTAAQYREIRMV